MGHLAATDDPEKLDEFIQVMRSYGDIEVIRSGAVAMSLEAKKLRLQPPVPAATRRQGDAARREEESVVEVIEES